MRGGLRWCSPLLLLWAAACTQDFSSFHFGQTNPARDRGNPSTSKADSGEDASAVNLDAMKLDVDSGLDAAVTTADAAGADASEAGYPSAPADAAISDGGTAGAAAIEDDAGVAPLSLPEQCAADWPALQTGSPECRGCACGDCAAPIVDCVTVGDETQRALCRNVLACAVQNHCQFGDCYCATSRCGWGTNTGDGPCAAVIDAAAGGKRTEVYALQGQDPPPLANPFVRALQAMGCMFGTDDAAPGPTLPAMCAATCI
jgi:hypothetical protein